MEKSHLRKVIISGDPAARGKQYGEKVKPLIEKSVGSYREAFKGVSGVTWEKALNFSKTFVKRIKEFDETLLEEMQGMAKGSGRLLEEILVINLRTEILFGLKKLHEAEGCTSFCALPDITRLGNTILGQNWDYKPFAAETMLLLQINQEKAPDILTLVEAGQLARMGMNSAGLGICNNYIECEADGMNMEKGVPTTFIRRRALSQEKYYAMIGTIAHTPRSFSGNYLVATAEGEGDATDIEATPETAYFPQRRPDRAFQPYQGRRARLHRSHAAGGGEQSLPGSPAGTSPEEKRLEARPERNHGGPEGPFRLSPLRLPSPRGRKAVVRTVADQCLGHHGFNRQGHVCGRRTSLRE
jgi:hypothetical protein